MIASREYVKDLISKVLNRYTKGYCKLAFEHSGTGRTVSISPNGIIPFDEFIDGNLEYNLTNGSIKLKAGKSYCLKAITHYTSGASYIVGFYDITNQKFLKTAMRVLGREDESNMIEDIYTPSIDCEVAVRLYWSSSNSSTLMRVTCTNPSSISLGLHQYDQEVVFMVVEI